MPSIVVTSAAAIWSLAMTHVGNERVGWDVGVLVEVAVPTGSVVQIVVLSKHLVSVIPIVNGHLVVVDVVVEEIKQMIV